MQENYWTMIDFLVGCIRNKGVDADELKNARYRLSVALDKRLVCNLPSDEIKRLISVLDGLYKEISI
ncbi:hypothetical protein [uncultured Bacteroides sp.]|uniref:hypothetical protein n=1 Tax=uncultured Bacteroides sp. TaxID=162156 RepID=UPI002599F6E3|nr:hypothetical protein [uncultured Bacteroides sp.]